MQICLSILVMLIFISCAHKNSTNLVMENKKFYRSASIAKRNLTPVNYKKWLINQINNKRAHIAGLEGVRDREGQLLGNHEMMTEGSASVSGQGGVHGFKAERSRQRLQELEDQKNLIKRHLFYLKSQLSQIEEMKSDQSPLRP